MSPRPNEPDSKNLLVAIALSLAVLLGFQFLYAGPQEEARRAAAEAEAAKAPPSPAAAVPGGAAAPATAAAAAGAAPAAGQPAAAPAAPVIQAPRIPLETEALRGTINAAGARIDQVWLERYRETVQPGSADVKLLHPQGSADGFYAFFGWSSAGGTAGALPGPDTVWTVPAGARLTTATPVTLTYDNGAGLVFSRRISVDDNYLLTFEDTVTNRTAAPVAIQPYGAIRRHSPTNEPPDPVNHQGVVGVLDGKLEKLKYREMEDGKSVQMATTGGWMGFTDRYWFAGLIPDQTERVSAAFKMTLMPGEEVFETSYVGSGVSVAPGASATKVQKLYVGSKNVDTLRAYEASLNLPRFDDAVDWGMFWFLTRPFYLLLAFFHDLIGNIGLAILAVTVVVKVVTFPLVYTSYKSFARLRDLAPKMKEMQERFAADKQRQQQEMIKLYQAEKINPVAGCVPILLQMPIFFALFKVLSISLELRHAPFYGWIPDLSAKDPTTVFNLFGLLPFDPTSWPFIGALLGIGAWPILYGISYWLLMKMQPPATDQLQRQIFAMMPWIFVIVFAGFGSGLVIYYTWSNLLTILQQYVIAKRTGSSNPIDEFFAKLKARGKPA
jgi:YidC/Oxa1 family membrane protein insertase